MTDPGDQSEPLLSSDPEVMGGCVVFAGTRVPVEVLFGSLADGMTVDETVDAYPTLRKEQVVGVLAEASRILSRPRKRVVRVEDLPPEVIGRIAQARMDEEYDYLDELMEPGQPNLSGVTGGTPAGADQKEPASDDFGASLLERRGKVPRGTLNLEAGSQPLTGNVRKCLAGEMFIEDLTKAEQDAFFERLGDALANPSEEERAYYASLREKHPPEAYRDGVLIFPWRREPEGR